MYTLKDGKFVKVQADAKKLSADMAEEKATPKKAQSK